MIVLSRVYLLADRPEEAGWIPGSVLSEVALFVKPVVDRIDRALQRFPRRYIHGKSSICPFDFNVEQLNTTDQFQQCADNDCSVTNRTQKKQQQKKKINDNSFVQIRSSGPSVFLDLNGSEDGARQSTGAGTWLTPPGSLSSTTLDWLSSADAPRLSSPRDLENTNVDTQCCRVCMVNTTKAKVPKNTKKRRKNLRSPLALKIFMKIISTESTNNENKSLK